MKIEQKESREQSASGDRVNEALEAAKLRLRGKYEGEAPLKWQEIREAMELAEMEARETEYPQLVFADLAEERLGSLLKNPYQSRGGIAYAEAA